VLGSGGFGRVYYAEWHGSPVACKMPHKSSIRHLMGVSVSTGVPKLREEAELLSRLRHPCICCVYGIVQLYDGRDAILLEYLDGGTLFALLHERGDESIRSSQADAPAPDATYRVDIVLACRIARETACGIAFLHANQCMQRDIKSTNVLLHGCVVNLAVALVYPRTFCTAHL